MTEADFCFVSSLTYPRPTFYHLDRDKKKKTWLTQLYNSKQAQVKQLEFIGLGWVFGFVGGIGHLAYLSIHVA